ncbi:hypothetical protein QWE_21741 [Agrobacterium albertimagni AOL15]|uniref:Uncharacterized protein n=1 Tax=Agrobacterium albertimagni AOL15 TaxID=1156935 RepID=K2Q162_9HYPH|nr:hypothetical protein [Agrobacterium albertimagni]EKF57409.1 hypothetical protein QWE_21741 [Agrobacterium albertimagni AOL15]
MRQFFETTFGPEELGTVGKALEDWRLLHGLPGDCEEVEIAASAILNMFREGKRSQSELTTAMAAHIGLQELVIGRRPPAAVHEARQVSETPKSPGAGADQ